MEKKHISSNYNVNRLVLRHIVKSARNSRAKKDLREKKQRSSLTSCVDLVLIGVFNEEIN